MSNRITRENTAESYKRNVNCTRAKLQKHNSVKTEMTFETDMPGTCINRLIAIIEEIKSPACIIFSLGWTLCQNCRTSRDLYYISRYKT